MGLFAMGLWQGWQFNNQIFWGEEVDPLMRINFLHRKLLSIPTLGSFATFVRTSPCYTNETAVLTVAQFFEIAFGDLHLLPYTPATVN